MIGGLLKKFRIEKGMTLKQIDSKINYGMGNLSNYENGKLKPKDETLFKILNLGFGLNEEESWDLIYSWKEQELKNSKTFRLAQKTSNYNKGTKKGNLEDALKKEGFNKGEIERIKKAMNENS